MLGKKHALGYFVLLLHCLTTVTHQVAQAPTHTHDNHWNFLEQRMLLEPSDLAKSYFERYFNWALPTVCFWASLNYHLEPKFLSDRKPYCDFTDAADKAIALAHKRSVIAAIMGICLTLYAYIRNSHYLVRAAEKELFIDLLDNWPIAKEHLPAELLGIFEEAKEMRSANPKQFNKKIAGFIKTVKQKTERHTSAL